MNCIGCRLTWVFFFSVPIKYSSISIEKKNTSNARCTAIISDKWFLAGKKNRIFKLWFYFSHQ